MIAFLSLFLHILVSPFKTQARLEAGILVLRHQLNLLRRQVPSKPRLTVTDRLIFVWLYRLFTPVLGALSMIEPETVIRWHRMGFRLYWRWKSRSRGGRPQIPGEIRHLIREMSLANRLWGAPRIHGELFKLGIEVAQSTVAKYMARSGRGRSHLEDFSPQRPLAGHHMMAGVAATLFGFGVSVTGLLGESRALPLAPTSASKDIPMEHECVFAHGELAGRPFIHRPSLALIRRGVSDDVIDGFLRYGRIEARVPDIRA
jgi:hypothetical protein